MNEESIRIRRSARHHRLARLVGEFIRNERHLQQMTQDALSDASGIPRQTINQLELGEVVLTYPRLLDIMYALDLSERACIRLLMMDSESRRVAA